jgi:hypothetical protein
LISLAISQVCRDNAGESKAEIRFPHIVADVVNHRKTQHLLDTNVKEIVCPTDYGIGLLAQSAIHPGLVKVYDHLLKFTPDGNELYLLDSAALPSGFRPGSSQGHFKDLSGWFEGTSRETKNPMILLGYLRKGEPLLNPQKDQTILQEGDQLILLAYCAPRLADLLV